MTGRPRDPLSVRFDMWARTLLAELAADPWQWRARNVISDMREHGARGLTETELAAQRSLYWCNGHAASSGAKIRPRWSLDVGWSAPRLEDGARHRMISARLIPREAGRAYYAERGA